LTALGCRGPLLDIMGICIIFQNSPLDSYREVLPQLLRCKSGI